MYASTDTGVFLKVEIYVPPGVSSWQPQGGMDCGLLHYVFPQSKTRSLADMKYRTRLNKG